MLMPGAKMTSFPRPRASSPNTSPNQTESQRRLHAGQGAEALYQYSAHAAQQTKSAFSHPLRQGDRPIADGIFQHTTHTDTSGLSAFMQIYRYYRRPTD